jgi:hypothetical protein
MTANPLGAALAAIEPDDNAAFQAALRVRLLDELRRRTANHNATVDGPAPTGGVECRRDLALTEELTLEPLQRQAQVRRLHWPLVAAAAVTLAAGLATTMVVRHRKPTVVTAPSAPTATSVMASGPDAASVANDRAIGKAAIFNPAQLGATWAESTLQLQPPTTSDMGVAACDPFRGKPALDPTYDTTTTQALFSRTGRKSTFDVVRVMPDAGIATQYMDSISDSAFPACYGGLIDASTGHQSKTTILYLPQLAVQPGDRALLIATDTRYLNGSAVNFNVWVQVGRVVVQVNPSPDLYEPDDPQSETQKVMSLAVETAKAALQSHP